MRLRITGISLNGNLAIEKYIYSIINPSTKDKIRMRTGRMVSNNIFKMAKMKPIVMVREEYELNPILYLEAIVENDYVAYGSTLLEQAKNTYLKLFSKDNCTEKDFNMEMLDD